MNPFVQFYLESALFFTDKDTEPFNSLSETYSISDFAETSIQEATKDCEQILEEQNIPDNQSMAIDFWLTRNYNGSGFWDNEDLTEEEQKSVTEYVHSNFQEKCVYLGEDGLLYFE